MWAEDLVLKTDEQEPAEQLSAFVVMAGRMPAGASPGAILNSVEVVSTPGAAADINRSLQSFPGVQLVDEGNALFVRGGDSSETATWVNGVRAASATRLNAPVASFSNSIDPMQAKTITFLNGGLGAQYGEVLSGAVDLTTQSAPHADSTVLNLASGAAGATQNLALGRHAGARFAATVTDTAPLLALNGTARDYEEKPNGYGVGVSGGWNYRDGAELKLYGNDQADRAALWVDQPGLHGLYLSRVHNQLSTVSWEDGYGDWRWSANAGGAGLWRSETTPAGTISTRDWQRQLGVTAVNAVSDRLALTVGCGVTGDAFGEEKSKTVDGVRWAFHRDLRDTRTGAYAQGDAVVARHVRAVVGMRADHSSATGRMTADPRLSLAWQPRSQLSFSVAGGSYHQVPDGTYFFGANGERLSRAAMRAQDAVVAAEYRGDSRLIRLEIYRKHFGGLAQLDRDRTPVGSAGRGEARGVDLFAKAELPEQFSVRVTCSLLKAERTDPDSGRLAPAPWDIRESVTAIVERPVGNWNVSLSYRYATGRSVTPVVGGKQDGTSWDPVYGEPFSERVPPLQRVDFLAYRVWAWGTDRAITTYVSINNVLNHANVYTYGYSDDYSRRWKVPSLFNRILYFGVTIYFN